MPGIVRRKWRAGAALSPAGTVGDGISLITYIREIQPSLPIIVFTGVGYEEEKMHAALRAAPTAT